MAFGTNTAATHAAATSGAGFFAGPHPIIAAANQIAQAPKPPKTKQPKSKSQSVSQVANQQVTQQLAPTLALQQQQAAQQNQAIQAFALQLLGQMKPVAGQVGSEYDNAIGQTAALGGATADALRNANPNQQDQQLLQSINAPAEQRGQVQNQLANTYGLGAGVQQFLGAEVPGTQLATDKAAAYSQAAGLPAIAALKGQQDLASAMQQQRNQLAQTEAQRPGLVQQATQTIKGNIAQRQGAAWDQYKFQTARADALDAAGQKEEAQRLRDQANLQYKYAALGSENARAAASQQGQNARTKARIDAADRRAAARLARSNPGMKPSDRRQAIKAIDLYYYGKNPTQHLDSTSGNYTPVPGTGTPGINYGQAVKQLMDGYGMTRAEAIKLANDYYAPGERGRPDPGQAAAAKKVASDNAKARKGKDASGLGIQIAPAP